MDTHKQQLNKNSNYRELTEKEKEEEEDVPLPGFRFHPTDEELVAFYLHRKVKKIPISIELIKEIDIYKYDPWDLPKGSNVGEKEWYFFCRRGRKYRNSIRPNRVTGSGFWKATGIDRPIYSGDGSVCIGLKKSLVYYRGSAGKGTKTDWMMHEFRLPPPSDTHNNNHMINQKSVTQEAEVWTLCRILKRTPCHKKPLPEWRQVPTRRSTPAVDTSSGDSDYDMQSYISFQAPVTHENKPYLHNHPHQQRHGTNQMIIGKLTTSVLTSEAPSATASCSSFSGQDVNDVIKHGDWDDLISLSVVDLYAVADPLFFT